MAREDTQRAIARRQNLEKAIKIVGSAANLSRATGISPAEISQMRNKDHPRNVGDLAAEKIEQSLSLPIGWMDHLHDEISETEKTSLTTNNQNSYTSSKKADAVIKEIINSVNSGSLSDEDVLLLGTMAKKIQRAPEPIDYSTHYPGLIDEDT